MPDGWVAVTVTAASLNMHDIWTLRGVGIKPDQFPMILGCDGAGHLEDGTEVVLHSIIGDPTWFGDETLDPKRTMLTELPPGQLRRDRGGAAAQRGAAAVRADGGAGQRDGHRVAHRVPDAVHQVGGAARADDARAGRLRRRVHRARSSSAAPPG